MFTTLTGTIQLIAVGAASFVTCAAFATGNIEVASIAGVATAWLVFASPLKR